MHTTQHQQRRLICHAFRTLSSVEYIAASLAHGSAQGPRSTKRSSLALVSNNTLSPIHRLSLRFTFPLQIQRTLTTATTATTPPEVASSTRWSEWTIKPGSAARAPRVQTKNPWTEQEDKLLFNLRQRKTPWKKISARFKRSVGSCYSHYYRILDPSLADAVEDDDLEKASWNRTAVETTQHIPAVADLAGEKNGGLSSPQGFWTARDRERLERLIHAKTHWSVIARELGRNQESCKEKWFRIQKSRVAVRRHAKRVRGKQWCRLFNEGFTPYHRDQLVKEVGRQLAAMKRSRSAANGSSDPLGLLEMEDHDADSGIYAMMVMLKEMRHQAGGDDDDNVGYSSAHGDATGAFSTHTGVKAVDWDAVALAFNNKFPTTRLQSIYHELAAAKLIWTPEEDDRLIRAVLWLGPPEFQPKLWTMIKDAFGDDIRTSEDYKSRWRELDMPVLEREWDYSEKTKFWRRWKEFQEEGSLFSLPEFSKGSLRLELENTSTVDGFSTSIPSETISNDKMWDIIAEGLEYRHGRDCQLHFERTTARFPRDPELFQYLVQEVANVYLKPKKTYWSSEASSMLVATVNSFLQASKTVSWESISKALNSQYTTKQCQARWSYWSQKQNREEVGQRKDQNHLDQRHAEKIVPGTQKKSEPRRRWTDRELELLNKGVQEYGHRWAKIRDALLPHRTIPMLHERYRRSQAKKTGKFSEKERSLLETAIETFGEDADWALVASRVPGRTACQCRKTWNYGRTHHVQKLDEPWTEQDKQRLKSAVTRFGTKQWTLVSDFVVGKSSAQCRKHWEEKLDADINTSLWAGKEVDQLMERVEILMARKEEEERVRIAEA
ncbi:Myb-like DNA-binding domain protein, partial [Modicella reniformis]